MGNTIALPDKISQLADSLNMSNGLTSVFIEVLVISGSILASTNREKELIIWLAQRDQSIVGIGTVGFKIDEIPWTTDSFDMEKAFIINTILHAKRSTGWERLSYIPNQVWLIDCLEKFQTMIAAFDKKDIDPGSYLQWTEIDADDESPTIPIGHPLCEEHFILLSCHGCILCNNGS